MGLKAKILVKGNRHFGKNTDIYSMPSNGTFFSPFSFNIDPMEHLILINFEKDPDGFYTCFELQQAICENGKKALLVIAYRKDGATDVYHQSGYPFGSQESVLNNPAFFERSMELARFEIKAGQIEVYFDLEDRMGREIKVRVTETNRQQKKPFFLVAPIGSISRMPTSLPVYSLYEMSFTRQKYTDIVIEIDKVKHKPDAFPIPIDWSKNYFTRYSADTFNVDWNKNFDGLLSPLIPYNNPKIDHKGITYELEEKGGHYEIKRMSAKNSRHKIIVEFFPAVPDIVCLKQEMDFDGNFSITTDNAAGFIRGNYQIKRQGNEIDFEINPSRGWEPNERRWVLKFLFFVVKVFREWPKSYVWNAKIKLDHTNQPTMQSGWKRV